MGVSLIQAYIWKRLFSLVILVAVITASMFLIVSVILWSPSMIANGWKQQQIFIYVVCEIPWFLSNIYPAVIAVGTLMAFTLFAQNNELVVLQASGLSQIDFIKLIFLPAIVLAIVGFILISYLGPMGYNFSEKIGLKSVSFHSVWMKEKNNIITIKKVPGNKLYDITIFDLKKSGIKKLYEVKEATFGNTSQLQSVIVKNYNKNAVTQQYLPKLSWPDLFPDAVSLKLLSKSQRRLSLLQLYQIIKMQKKMGLSSKNYQFRLWQMILLPFFSLMLMFTMIPFAFREKRSKGFVNTMVLGLVISLIFYFFNQTAWSLSVLLNLPMFLGALIAPVSVTLLLIIFLW